MSSHRAFFSTALTVKFAKRKFQYARCIPSESYSTPPALGNNGRRVHTFTFLFPKLTLPFDCHLTVKKNPRESPLRMRRLPEPNYISLSRAIRKLVYGMLVFACAQEGSRMKVTIQPDLYPIVKIEPQSDPFKNFRNLSSASPKIFSLSSTTA